MAAPPSRKRRAFSQQNLAFRQEGPLGETLAEALRVPEQGGYALTHGFHPYPGRFHFRLPHTLLKTVAKPGDRVLDPFMGGGTTVVEALLLGLRATGNDLNPVAWLVARERTRARTARQAERLTGEAGRIAAQVESLRREKNPPRAKLRNLERLAPLYQQHLLAELAQWMRLINALPKGGERESLRAVFSSAVVKYSNQASDSQSRTSPPRYGKGAVSRFLVAKCGELARAQTALAGRIPREARATLYQEDAALLPSLGWDSADCILTSPPYPGTYDYYEQHTLRMAWLELNEEALRDQELGARRDPHRERWSHGMGDVFTAFYRVLRPGGSAFIVLADWADGNHAVDASASLRRIAQGSGWRPGSSAAVRRVVHNHREKKAFVRNGKWEHLIELVRPQ